MRSARARGTLTMALVALSLCVACGTSIRGMYESDVRFEHCMALDAATELKATVQRACWDEWLSFYTFGQTRDRIDYARGRTSALGAANNFDEGGPPANAASRAVPDPTSAIAPPPSMLVSSDAGTQAPAAPEKPRDRCTVACDAVREACQGRCKGAACDAACGGREARCRATCARGSNAGPR